MKAIILTDRIMYLEIQSLAQYQTGGWCLPYKGIKPRTNWFKKHFCGNILKADINFTSKN